MGVGVPPLCIDWGAGVGGLTRVKTSISWKMALDTFIGNVGEVACWEEYVCVCVCAGVLSLYCLYI